MKSQGEFIFSSVACQDAKQSKCLTSPIENRVVDGSSWGHVEVVDLLRSDVLHNEYL